MVLCKIVKITKVKHLFWQQIKRYRKTIFWKCNKSFGRVFFFSFLSKLIKHGAACLLSSYPKKRLLTGNRRVLYADITPIITPEINRVSIICNVSRKHSDNSWNIIRRCRGNDLIRGEDSSFVQFLFHLSRILMVVWIFRSAAPRVAVDDTKSWPSSLSRNVLEENKDPDSNYANGRKWALHFDKEKRQNMLMNAQYNHAVNAWHRTQ